MEASDYLTEMVQRFTLEGDTQYLEHYLEDGVFVDETPVNAVIEELKEIAINA